MEANMNTLNQRIIILIIGYALIFLSGYWLSHAVKPYGSIILTLHKLISLAAAVLLVLIVVKIHGTVPLLWTEWLAWGITALFFIVTVISGGLISAMKQAPVIVTLAHRIAPFLTVLGTAASIYLVLSRKK
jgi:hypothetical protein